MPEAIAYGTMITTLGLVLSNPRITGELRLGPAMPAAFGVIVLLATNVVSWADLRSGFDALWRPSLTILSLMLCTNAAHRLCVFDGVARMIARPGQHSAAMFRNTFAFSAVTAAVLNNDAAVLLLTPLIVGSIRRCYPQRPQMVVPFAFAVFSAAGVAPLVISNPMNLIVAEYAGIGFNEYAVRMIPVAVAGWLFVYVTLRFLVFRSEMAAQSVDVGASRTGALSRPALHLLLALLVSLCCYPVFSYARGPLWVVSIAMALVAVVICWKDGVASPRELCSAVPWDILAFLFCVFVIVLGLRNVGAVERLASLYAYASNSVAQLIIIAVSSAIGSAAINNHPMAILNALTIQNLSTGTRQQVLAALVGGDLGPRLLPVGSLAGLMWFNSLRRLGVHISLAQFVRVGIVVTVPSLAVSLVILLFTP